MPAPPRALLSWSSGKDSAWALHVARSQGEVEIVGLLTTVTSSFGRVSMHGVREEILARQARSVGLPLTTVSIPSPCSNEVYAAAMHAAMTAARAQGIECVVFGDLFLADIRAYREANLASVGMRAVFPLWGRDTGALAKEMIAGGLRAILTCVDPRRVSRELAGRWFDAALIDALPEGVDPCGEHGEFHTCVVAGPMLGEAIAVERGEVVEREGFVFADVVPLPE